MILSYYWSVLQFNFLKIWLFMEKCIDFCLYFIRKVGRYLRCLPVPVYTFRGNNQRWRNFASIVQYAHIINKNFWFARPHIHEVSKFFLVPRHFQSLELMLVWLVFKFVTHDTAFYWVLFIIAQETKSCIPFYVLVISRVGAQSKYL